MEFIEVGRAILYVDNTILWLDPGLNKIQRVSWALVSMHALFSPCSWLGVTHCFGSLLALTSLQWWAVTRNCELNQILIPLAAFVSVFNHSKKIETQTPSLEASHFISHAPHHVYRYDCKSRTPPKLHLEDTVCLVELALCPLPPQSTLSHTGPSPLVLGYVMDLSKWKRGITRGC